MADPTSPQVESGRDGLMACPFCGGEAMEFRSFGPDRICCHDQGCPGYELSATKHNWNTRAATPATALLAECAEVMRDTITALVDAGAWEEATRLDAFIERIGRVE